MDIGDQIILNFLDLLLNEKYELLTKELANFEVKNQQDHTEYHLIKRTFNVLHAAKNYINIQKQGGGKRKAPWKDYEGGELVDGDYIIHPSGEMGRVWFDSTSDNETDQWRVIYDQNKDSMSRLCLQVGEKGQAVRYKGVLV